MARARNIKPSFFTNEKLADLSFSTRLLFIGLWTMCDRLGRMEDRPKRIKMNLFPADRVDVNKGLTELATHGFITRYVVDGEAFIEIPTFLKHQSPHIKEAASTIPAPDKHGASTVKESLNPESSFLNPESNGVPPAAVAASEKDPVERRIWTDGKDLLAKAGMKPDASGAFLGKLAKDHGKTNLAKAIAVAQAENPADPKTYIVGVLNKEAKAKTSMHIGKFDEESPPIEIDLQPCQYCGNPNCLLTHDEERRAA